MNTSNHHKPNPLYSSQSIAFPPPPWKGNTRTKPLTSSRQLKRFAGIFENYENCLNEIIWGCRYFYAYQSDLGLIHLRNDGAVGWRMAGGCYFLSGGKSRVLQIDDVGKICRDFTDAGFSFASPCVITYWNNIPAQVYCDFFN